MSKSIELTVTLTIRPETDDMQALVTISEDHKLICHTLPIREALQSLRFEIDRLLEDAERKPASTHD